MEKFKSGGNEIEKSIITPSPKQKPKNFLKDITIQNELALKKEYAFMSWKGPFPPPEAVEKYEQIQPGSANRLLLLLEKEAVARHEKSLEIIKNDSNLIRNTFITEITGQIFGFLVVISAIVAGVIISIYGNPAWGGIVSLTGLATLGGAFLISKVPLKRIKEKNN